MGNNFGFARNSYVPPAQEQVQKRTIYDDIDEYKKAPSNALAGSLLKAMEPTINAALTSFAQSDKDSLRIKAASLTLKALKSYDKGIGVHPSTYVFHNLKRLNRLSHDRSNIIKEPEATTYLRGRLQTEISKFMDSKGYEPTVEQLSDILAIPERKVEALMDSGNVVSQSEASGDQTQTNGEIGSKDLTDVDFYKYVYASVGDIDKKIMEWSSGINGNKKLKAVDIAARLKMSPAAVSQRVAKIQQLLSEVRGLL